MAIDLNGTTQYVLVADNDSLSFPTGGFSIVAWVNLDVVNALQHIVAKYAATKYEYYLGHEANGSITFMVYDNSVPAYMYCGTAVSKLTQNKWHYICGTFDGGTDPTGVKVYVDGVLDTTTQTESGTFVAMENLTQPVYIGTKDAADYFVNGRVEDVRIFNKELTAEGAALLAAGYRGPLGGEVLWLSMNEARTLATPGTLTQGTHLLPDLSVNSNDGDPYGDAVLVASDCPRMGVVV